LTSLDLAWCGKLSDVCIQRLVAAPHSAPALKGLRSINLRGCTKVSRYIFYVALLNNNAVTVFKPSLLADLFLSGHVSLAANFVFEQAAADSALKAQSIL
jgi:hypothetical protein